MADDQQSFPLDSTACAPTADLYRIVAWQAFAQDLSDGQTVEKNVPPDHLEAAVAGWRLAFVGDPGVIVGYAPMAFVLHGAQRADAG